MSEEIRIAGFVGERPAIGERLLSNNMATQADNCRLNTGEIIAIDGLTTEETPSKAGTINTLYLWKHEVHDVTVGTFTVNTATEFLTITGHDLANGEAVMVSSTGTLPTGLSPQTRYWVVGVSGGTFQLAATYGGSAINITGVGSGVHTCRRVGYWFHWTEDVSVARSPIADLTDYRVVYTFDDESAAPRMTYETLADDGSGTDYPISSYLLGVTSPSVAPNTTVTGTADDVNEVPEVRTYLYTRVSGQTEQGVPSPASTDINWRTGQGVDVILFEDLPKTTEGYNITSLYLYRVNSGVTDAEYQFVAELSASNYDEVGDIESVNTSTEHITITAHGLSNDDRVHFTTTGALPTGLSINVAYFVVNKTTNTFQVSLTLGGSAVDLTGAGSGTSTCHNTAVYADAVAADDLGEVLPSEEWDVPPTDMHHVTEMPNGMLVAASRNSLCFSEPYQPHAWPETYRQAVDADIVALGVFGSTVVVTTKNEPWLAHGVHPDSVSLEKLEVPYPCVSGQGMVDMGMFVLYPSIDGLVKVSRSEVSLVTDGVITPKQWRALKPSTFKAFRWDELYFAFYDDGTSQKGIIFDPRTASITYTDATYATGGYLNPLTGDLYLQDSAADIEKWDADSSSSLTALWKSKIFATSAFTNYGFARVDADSFNVTFKLYGDGVLRHTETVTSDDPFPLTPGYTARFWQVEISSAAGPIKSVEVAKTLELLQKAYEQPTKVESVGG
jgi:hypothetical protein